MLWNRILLFIVYQIPWTSGILSDYLHEDPPIDLKDALSPFRSCTISVFINDVTIQSEKYHQPYKVVPLDIPVINSLFFYRRTNSINYRDGNFWCDDVALELVPKQGYKFVASPPTRQVCFVLVYIDPKPCARWYHTFRPHSQNQDLLEKTQIPNFFSPANVYYYRYLRLSLYSPIKSRVYLSHVKMHRSNDLQYNAKHMQSIPALIDIIWSIMIPLIANQAHLTKVTVQLIYSKRSNTFIAKYTALIPCFEYESFLKKMKRNCKNLNPSEGTYCASQLAYNWLENKAVPKYSSKEISSHADLSSLHLKGCPRVAFIIEGPNYVKMRSGAYLLDFKSEEQGIHQALIESVCHNCTVENAEWRGLPLLSIGIFPLFSMQYEAYTRGDILFSGKSNTVHFVTCYPTRKPGWFSLLGYITAFDLFTWITLVGTGVLTGLVIKQVKDSKDWCQFGFVCKILLCQGARNTPYSQWIGGSWLMTGIILVFFYQADSIERLTAPLVENKLSDFNEMLKSQFRVFTPSIEFGLLPYVQLINTLKESNDPQDNLDVAELEKEVLNLNRISLFANLLGKNNVNVSKEELAKVHPEIRHPVTIEEAIDMLNVSFFVERMCKCKKEAFVDISPGVEFMKRQLQAVGISKRQMSWSEKPYDYALTRWDFRRIPYPPDWFLLRIRSLAQSGLVEIWQEWKTRVVSWNDKVEEARVVEETVRSLSLQDNTAVVFYLHAALLLITLVTFITETLPYAIVGIRIFGGIAITLIRSGASFCMNALNKKCG